jgi:acid phosphatase (class A)
MKVTRRTLVGVALLAVGVAGGGLWRSQHPSFHYLSGDPQSFVAEFGAPPAADSADARHELDELLGMQRGRTPAQVAAAQADRKKDVTRFYAALGLDAAQAPNLPKLRTFTEAAETDIGPYVRAVKEKYRRLRPYEIESKLEPCIGDVKGDLSYPSGHATYGYLVGEMLSELVPERRVALMERAADFANQRMVCGVHFRSDIDAGRRGAHYLFEKMHDSAAYRRDSTAAGAELRAALGLATHSPLPSDAAAR